MSHFLFPRSLSLFFLLSFFKAQFALSVPFCFIVCSSLLNSYCSKIFFLPNSTCAASSVSSFLSSHFHSFFSYLFWKLPRPLCVNAASFLLPSFFLPFPSSFLPYMFSSHLPLSPLSPFIPPSLCSWLRFQAIWRLLRYNLLCTAETWPGTHHLSVCVRACVECRILFWSSFFFFF